ncbi:hypothetical protein SAMN05421636_103310 [Pricia antarctica]|uniref:Uncharacterized protein n=1 Tax=Pricia antarctica TaxID=641691 RepID=A0A1G7ADE6_9FLAO|nr:hypothetical protein [Pricia antarctica]SDE12055.1 hypothetical protein SAMN05421636_103310 [Pricia antarctica]
MTQYHIGTDGTKWVHRPYFFWSDMGTEGQKRCRIQWIFMARGRKGRAALSPIVLSCGHEGVGRTLAEGIAAEGFPTSAGAWHYFLSRYNGPSM